MQIIERSNIRNIYVSLNYICNNKCLMCGVPFNKHNRYNETLDFYISELNKVPFTINETDIVTISGGEPFLFRDLFSFIEYIKSKFGCRITIFTNGRALKNREIVGRIKGLNVDKLVIPFFSYDMETYDMIAGSKGAYEEVIKGLKNLNEKFVYNEVKFLPMKQNALDIAETYDFIKSHFPRTKFTICGVQYFGEAVHNSDKIGIKYCELKEELEKTFDEAQEKYNEIIPLYRFPMCVLDAKYNNNGVLTLFQEYIIGPDYSDVALSDDSKKKFSIPAECRECLSFCDWYSQKYKNIFGMEELNALGGVKT
ncbi:MAG: radical SAM protein [Lachnospiraceae bacterium]|nr:radical SAM protein [Lachnospiraceae bacterium]